jgi:3-oxoacyl-(acyl-carrier-protein) synthase/NAD(P)-dependent dehydrogenase (short-subunit alcohol dehydrogenase family)/acyl carrier protein
VTEHHIAILGFRARVPGASDEQTLWDNLASGRITLRRYDAASLRALGRDPALLSDPRFVPVDGRLEDADQFDAEFFGISAREAERTDPQHRLLLECGWELLQHIGYGRAARRPVTGVFAGASMNTYLPNVLRQGLDLVSFHGTELMLGNDKDYLTARLSYKLGLTGPSLAVQTGCSSSLVAVHLAVQSLLAGECELALAGGVAVHASPPGYFYEPGLMFSPDGLCRAFDADAQGTPFGDGVGLVALRRLEDALADGDPIRAVILGSATNNDGAQRAGFTAPSVEGQRVLISEAQGLARVDPSEIGLVETHGTGTPLGDPVEFRALCEVFEGKAARGACALGAVKANLGHLAAAAGVTGLVKALLAVERGEIPPHPTFRRPHPQLGMEGSPFFVNTQPVAWPVRGPRRAGVTSLGVGGSNAHVVLEQAPVRPRPVPRRAPVILPLSARDERRLHELVSRTAAWLSGASVELPVLAATLQQGREEEPVRVAVAGSTHDELARALRGAEPAAGRHSKLLLVVGERATAEEVASWTERCDCPVLVTVPGPIRAGDPRMEGALPWSPAQVEPAHVVLCLGLDPEARAEVQRAAQQAGARLVEPGEDALARVWAAGISVRWPEAGEGRAAAPYPPLVRRRYWLEPGGDAASAPASEDPRQWLFAESWIRGEPLGQAGTVSGPVLLLEDERGLGARVAEGLAARGVAVVRVARSERPDPERYAALRPAHVLCLWPLGRFEPVQDTHALYTLARTLAAAGTQALEIVGEELVDVLGMERVDAARSSVLGLLPVLSQELPLRCRALDLGPYEHRVDAILRWLSHPGPAGLAALRHDRLWLQHFERPAGGRPLSLTAGGACLVTGGTGSVGATLGAVLARRHGLPLLLLGRTPLPERARWASLLAGPSLDPGLRARLQRLVALEQEGVRFEVLAADTSDRASLEGAIARGEQLLGEVRSFVHAAGPGGASASSWRDRAGADRWREVMAGKVQGARHLHEILGRRPGRLELGVFVSSLAAVAGGLGLGAYASANRLLDGFVQEHRDAPYLVLDWEGWSTWEDVASVSQERRRWALTPEQAGQAFELALQQVDLRRVLVSRVALSQRLQAPAPAAEPAAEPLSGPVAPPPPREEPEPLEDGLARLWGEVLRVEIDAEANFFDLGGDSLLGVELVKKVNLAYGTRLVISDVFDAPSVRAMAARLAQERRA